MKSLSLLCVIIGAVMQLSPKEVLGQATGFSDLELKEMRAVDVNTTHRQYTLVYFAAHEPTTIWYTAYRSQPLSGAVSSMEDGNRTSSIIVPTSGASVHLEIGTYEEQFFVLGFPSTTTVGKTLVPHVRPTRVDGQTNETVSLTAGSEVLTTSDGEKQFADCLEYPCRFVSEDDPPSMVSVYRFPDVASWIDSDLQRNLSFYTNMSGVCFQEVRTNYSYSNSVDIREYVVLKVNAGSLPGPFPADFLDVHMTVNRYHLRCQVTTNTLQTCDIRVYKIQPNSTADMELTVTFQQFRPYTIMAVFSQPDIASQYRCDVTLANGGTGTVTV